MGERRTTLDVRVALVICVCFLFTSTGWLSWLYRIVALDASAPVDFLTMVCGYLVQALGIGIYALFARTGDSARRNRMMLASLGAYVLLLVPSTVAGGIATTIAFGLGANIPCGVIQGIYLHLLAERIDSNRRGTVFGCAYAASTLLTWLLSLPAASLLTRGVPCLVVCCALAFLAAWLYLEVSGFRGEASTPRMAGDRTGSPTDRGRDMPRQATSQAVMPGVVPTRELLMLAGAGVIMSSLVKTVGFSFPAADLASGVNLELSRLLYGLGLVAAGLASDRDRRYSLLFCAVALVMPFLMLALSGAGASGGLLWALGYFLTGFYMLFRVLLMIDLADLLNQAGPAEKSYCPLVAVSGLMLGRIGDALGTALCLALASAPVVLIAVSSVLFVVTMGLIFALYQRLYLQVSTQIVEPVPECEQDIVPTPTPVPERSEREVFEGFAATYSLTARERDVLRLVLTERSNSEIAGELFVSEATVKYHVGNLLKKTGCANRLEILALYARG